MIIIKSNDEISSQSFLWIITVLQITIIDDNLEKTIKDIVYSFKWIVYSLPLYYLEFNIDIYFNKITQP